MLRAILFDLDGIFAWERCSRPAKMRGMHCYAMPRPQGKASRCDFTQEGDAL